MAGAVQRLSEEELRIFSEKISRRLAERPLDIDAASHRERVAHLLRQAGEGSFYQLLGIVPTATAQEVHEAYDQIARLVHSVNAPRLGLAGREGVLDLLFERITLAYLTLIQPDRRKAHDRELGPAAWNDVWTPAPERRQEEVRAIAHGYFERATALAAAEDFHFAIQLLEQAVRTDPKPEYHALLGKLLAKNPSWLAEAAEHLRHAVSLGARDPELPAALAEIQNRVEAGEAREPAAEEIEAPLPQRRKRRR